MSSSKTYTNASKRALANRMSEITSKKHLKDLFKIAYSTNNNYTKSAEGVHINLQILSSDALAQLEEYLDEHYPIVNAKPIGDGVSSYCSESNGGVNRLTNRERGLLKQIDSMKTATRNSNVESATKTDSASVKISSKITVKPFL